MKASLSTTTDSYKIALDQCTQIAKEEYQYAQDALVDVAKGALDT